MKLIAGDLAPKFILKDQNNKTHSLSEYLGQWLLIYFYPKDFTPGCTTQACGIRDNWESVQSAGLTIVGISGDSVEKHFKFVAKHDLPFSLLSDESKEVIKSYGSSVEKLVFGKKVIGISRDSFLIDPSGKITKIYRKVKSAKHLDMILKDFSELKPKSF